LFQIVNALDPVRLPLAFDNQGQQHAREDHNDGNYHQQFD
jgi:hypothetical protein